jgi:hypothetical protein
MATRRFVIFAGSQPILAELMAHLKGVLPKWASCHVERSRDISYF